MLWLIEYFGFSFRIILYMCISIYKCLPFWIRSLMRVWVWIGSVSMLYIYLCCYLSVCEMSSSSLKLFSKTSPSLTLCIHHFYIKVELYVLQRMWICSMCGCTIQSCTSNQIISRCFISLLEHFIKPNGDWIKTQQHYHILPFEIGAGKRCVLYERPKKRQRHGEPLLKKTSQYESAKYLYNLQI